MQWSEEVQTQVEKLAPVQVNSALLQKMMGLIDYTSLNADDTESKMAFFSEKARNPLGEVAAVCVNPQFTRMMVTQFAGTKVRVATVANFPQGNDPLEEVLFTINSAIEDGAQELDVVFPYTRFLKGDKQYANEFIEACKAGCGPGVLLKVILETSIYKNEDQIVEASEIAINAGADFLKTSTGKNGMAASLEAAAVVLLLIMQLRPGSSHEIGLKVSGGIRTVQEAAQYMELADNIMGRNWIKPQTFRIGASKLVDELLKAPQVI